MRLWKSDRDQLEPYRALVVKNVNILPLAPSGSPPRTKSGPLGQQVAPRARLRDSDRGNHRDRESVTVMVTVTRAAAGPGVPA